MKTMQGATLATTLLLLFVITLIGVTAIQVTHMQEKMTANLQDKELSFRAAESALSAGEDWIVSLQQEPTLYEQCPEFPCVQNLFINFDYAGQSASWWQANSAAFNGALKNIAAPPRYIIEFLQFVPDSPVVGSSSSKSTGVYYYQVTARGTGATDDAVTILQTTTARRF
ncbi:PilX N-terminal domain-containing pilus assembly protein [Legionella dresdenensis]|uniref:PilX N-terminal domain-containing pilus assembly protein n=1 Tax=Legionella dresdenensis TaxID=450200 RepID=A0ABV8CC81_9GAMM